METSGFIKKLEVRDASAKYGFTQLGVFALDSIKKGDVLFKCNPLLCFAVDEPFEESRVLKTKEEIKELTRERPDYKELIERYATCYDHDLFYILDSYLDKDKEKDGCLLFNHSCDSNAYYNDQLDSGNCFIAKRDIAPGEEVTSDYQTVETEFWVHHGLSCKCGSPKCTGLLKLDRYRDKDWVAQNYKYCQAFVRERIDELKTKWYSSSCYVKRSAQNRRELHLTALRCIEKDELVAVFADPSSSINSKSHFIQHNSDSPTCYCNELGQVFARDTIQPETELTLRYVLD